MLIRRAAVAGSWYPDDPVELRAEITEYLAQAAAASTATPDGDLVALVAPHAGLRYSGPVAAHAYRLLATCPADLVVLIGPSHFVAFDGVSIWPDGQFETPFGPLPVDEAMAGALLDAPGTWFHEPAHVREHSLEMQLPFIAALKPKASIVPLVMGHQTRAAAMALGDSLAACLTERQALLVASSDLSHYFDASIAASLDRQVLDDLEAFDADRLMTRLEQRPDHACGGGPMVATLRAARRLGGTTCRVLRYADSGDVSGDKQAVVGYVAAGVWQ